MSLDALGHATCDGCGTAVANGGVHAAAYVSVLDADGQPRQLHLCYTRHDGGKVVKGCATKALHAVTSTPPAPPVPPVEGESVADASLTAHEPEAAEQQKYGTAGTPTAGITGGARRATPHRSARERRADRRAIPR